jgi:hypothetical protein
MRHVEACSSLGSKPVCCWLVCDAHTVISELIAVLVYVSRARLVCELCQQFQFVDGASGGLC